VEQYRNNINIWLDEWVLYVKWSLKVGIQRLLEGEGLISLDFPGTSTHNGFWVTYLIGKFIAVSQVLQVQTMLLHHSTT
jgi:hypothetical protein